MKRTQRILAALAVAALLAVPAASFADCGSCGAAKQEAGASCCAKSKSCGESGCPHAKADAPCGQAKQAKKCCGKRGHAQRHHDEPSVGNKVADAVIVRPISMALSFATTGLYLGTTPITGLTNTHQEAADVLVRGPWYFTSARELGRF